MRTTYEWSKSKFHEHRRAVVYLDVVNIEGENGIGTAFHVGEGIFITARHVVEGMDIKYVCIDNGYDPLTFEKEKEITQLEMINGPHYHSDNNVDLACFVVKDPPSEYFKLGAHFDCFLGGYDLVLHKTLLFGFPLVPLTKRPHLIVSTGEVNGLVEKYGDRQIGFITQLSQTIKICNISK